MNLTLSGTHGFYFSGSLRNSLIIEDTSISGSSGRGLYVSTTGRYQITGLSGYFVMIERCTITDNSNYAIYYDGPHDMHVRNNNFDRNKGGAFIRKSPIPSIETDESVLEIIENTFQNGIAGNNVLYLDVTFGCQLDIRNNNFTDNNAYYQDLLYLYNRGLMTNEVCVFGKLLHYN